MAVKLLVNEDISGLLRNDPDANIQRVQSSLVPNVLRPDATQALIYRAVLDWMATRWVVKIANDKTAAGDYPLDGGTTPAQGSLNADEIKLNAAAEPQPGMILQIATGSGGSIGEWGIIDTVTGSPPVCKITRNWTTAPDSGGGQITRLMVPSWVASRALLRGEFSVDKQQVLVAFLFYDLGLDQTGVYPGGRIRARPCAQGPYALRTVASSGASYASPTLDSESGAEFHSDVLSLAAIGGTGFKVRLLEDVGSGNLTMWGAWA